MLNSESIGYTGFTVSCVTCLLACHAAGHARFLSLFRDGAQGGAVGGVRFITLDITYCLAIIIGA